MHPCTTSVQFTRLSLVLSADHFLQEGIGSVTFTTPRIVLCCAKVKMFKSVNALIAMYRKIQLGIAILTAEEQTKRVLRVTFSTTKPTSNSNPSIDLKSVTAIGIQQLNRSRTLPLATTLAWIFVDADAVIEKIF